MSEKEFVWAITDDILFFRERVDNPYPISPASIHGDLRACVLCFLLRYNRLPDFVEDVWCMMKDKEPKRLIPISVFTHAWPLVVGQTEEGIND